MMERYEQRVPLIYDRDLNDFMEHAKQLLIEENVVSTSEERVDEQTV